LYNAVLYDPGVFAAMNPYHAVQFFVRNGFSGWRMLGGILLCVTGTEAMFADLGHFNVPAIQVKPLPTPPPPPPPP
jgi:KUP system potassium uptake protein